MAAELLKDYSGIKEEDLPTYISEKSVKDAYLDLIDGNADVKEMELKII